MLTVCLLDQNTSSTAQRFLVPTALLHREDPFKETSIDLARVILALAQKGVCAFGKEVLYFVRGRSQPLKTSKFPFKDIEISVGDLESNGGQPEDTSVRIFKWPATTLRLELVNPGQNSN